jgi:hypothetical protein
MSRKSRTFSLIALFMFGLVTATVATFSTTAEAGIRPSGPALPPNPDVL